MHWLLRVLPYQSLAATIEKHLNASTQERNNMANDLLHKFIFIDHGEYMRSGEIVGMACDHVFLVKLDPNDNPPVSVLLSVSDMVESDACFIFDSRDELDTWTAWLEKDDRKVVELKRVEH